MANRPKDQGTRRETWLVRLAEKGRSLTARRAENNAPGRDVDINADVLRIAEVKDRQNLNVHKTLKATQAAHPGLPAAVVWHRTSKKDGNRRASPDGPTIVALPVEDWLDLLDIAKDAAAVANHAGDGPEADGLMAELRLGLGVVRSKYPRAAGRW